MGERVVEKAETRLVEGPRIVFEEEIVERRADLEVEVVNVVEVPQVREYVVRRPKEQLEDQTIVVPRVVPEYSTVERQVSRPIQHFKQVPQVREFLVEKPREEIIR